MSKEKRYVYQIWKGSDRFSCDCDCLKATEILKDWAYNMDNAVVVFEGSNKTEALAELKKYHCNAQVVKTNSGFQYDVDLVELEEILIDDEGETDEITIIATAKFLRKWYRYR